MKKYVILPMNYLTLFSILFSFQLFFSGCLFKKQDSLTVINVLDRADYDDCHIKGSINIPFEEFESKSKNMNKNGRYVLYCSNYACTAAPFLAEEMQKSGFSHIFVYHGGIVEWFQKGYPYVGPAQKEYLKEENEILSDESENTAPHIHAEQLLQWLKESGTIH